jgi:hypothetical protein
VLRSTDGGRAWTIAQTPVATGEATGLFSIAFRDAQHGVVVGGNYRQEGEAADNAAFTEDGGATWTLARQGQGLSGFRSVVAYVPGNARKLFAIGPSGWDWSEDDGRSWTSVGDRGFDTFSVARRGGAAWAAGQAGRIAKITSVP